MIAPCRHPIHLGFALTLWTGPVWTVDHLLVALIWPTYCTIAPLPRERRRAWIHGESFADFRSRMTSMFPRPAA